MASVIVRVLASVFTIVAPLFMVILPNLPFIVIVSASVSPSMVFPFTVKLPPKMVFPTPVTFNEPTSILPSISTLPLISKLVASISPDSLKITLFDPFTLKDI